MSAVIEDGVYQIVSLYTENDVPLAVDVANDSNAVGANIRLWPLNDADAQRWAVTNFDYDGGMVQLTAVMSGRCMDIANNEYKSGTQIRQWTDNDSNAQRFDIVADGQTATVNGTTYNTYKIYAHYDHGFCVDVAGEDSQAVSNRNIWLYEDLSGDKGQRFVFIPIEHFSQPGAYRILTAMSEDLSLDLEGDSYATYANVEIYPNNETEAQKWLVLPNDQVELGGVSGTITLIHPGAWKAVDENGASNQSGTNIQIYPLNFTAAQCWFAVRDGSMYVDGQLVPTYRLALQASEGSNQLCMDASGAVARQPNVIAYTRNDGPNQRWAFIPTSVQLSDMPTPSKPTLSTNIGNSKSTVQYSFICNYKEFQCRYRIRVRRVEHDSFDSWSPWLSTTDGGAGNMGWGNEWEPTITADPTDPDAKTADLVIPSEYVVDGSTIAQSQIQLEVRTFGSHTHRIQYSK